MIFTEDDKASMSEELGLVGMTLDRAIAQALIFAEGQNGAQRPLQITRYTDVLEVASDRVFLSYMPVVELPAPLVYARLRSQGSFGRRRPQRLREWALLSQLDYEIDYSTGEMTVDAGFEEVKIEYSSGFAFQDPLSAEELKIKEAIASILSIAIADSGYSQGVKEFSVNNFYSIKYADSGATSSAMSGKSIGNTAAQDFLIELRKYRPHVLPI